MEALPPKYWKLKIGNFVGTPTCWILAEKFGGDTQVVSENDELIVFLSKNPPTNKLKPHDEQNKRMTVSFLVLYFPKYTILLVYIYIFKLIN